MKKLEVINLSQFWTWDDYDTIRKEYPYKGKAITEDLPERSLTVIENKAERLNTYIHTTFTEQELKVAKSFGKSLKGCLLFLLPNRTPREIEELLACVSKS